MKTSGVNAIIMKEVNTNLVRNALKAERRSTKQKLSELTGLSAVTVASILQLLISTNEVYGDDVIPSNGGRPSQRFCYNYEHSHALVIYTHEYQGVDEVYIRVVNLAGECIHKEKTRLDDIRLDSFEPLIDALTAQYPTIKAIGFGMPGKEYEEIMAIADYKSINDTRFTEHYRNRYSLPVVFENDVNAAVVGYCHKQRIESEAAIVYLYFPQKYPPGAGIYINGRLYKGHANFAGEIKYMPLDIDWSSIDYDEFDQTCDAVAKLVSALICALGPERIVLYGSFLTKGHLDAVAWTCGQTVPELFMPQILLSSNFDLDFEIGTIEYTLDLLESKLALNK